MNAAGPDALRFKTKRRSVSWLISFGDLLTLLLCFFIAIVSASPINPAVRDAAGTKQASAARGPNHSLSETLAGRQRGTAIAKLYSKGGGANVAKLLLRRRDFAKSALVLSPRSLRDVKKQITPKGYILRQVVLEACDEFGRAAGESNLLPALERALALRSQLIDAGAAPAQIGARVVGANCTVLGNQRALAVMSFEMEKVRHG